MERWLDRSGDDRVSTGWDAGMVLRQDSEAKLAPMKIVRHVPALLSAATCFSAAGRGEVGMSPVRMPPDDACLNVMGSMNEGRHSGSAHAVRPTGEMMQRLRGIEVAVGQQVVSMARAESKAERQMQLIEQKVDEARREVPRVDGTDEP